MAIIAAPLLVCSATDVQARITFSDACLTEHARITDRIIRMIEAFE